MNSPKILVMTPTYNEAKNLPILVNKLLNLPFHVEIAIIDDESPDGTGKLADELAKQHPGLIHPVHRQGPRGRGRAGLDGFRLAVKKEYIDYVVEMDADLSHDPERIPDLIKAMQKEKADVAVGSRAVAGGYEEGRNWLRRTLTVFANFYIRTLLGVKVRDCTSGFRCFKREVLASIGLYQMISTGPWVVQEVLFHCAQKGFKIIEVPYTFRNRTLGESTLNWKILIHSLLFTWYLFFKRLKKAKT